MDYIINIIALAITLLILVGVHEFGHFYIARLCGVKVLKFSIGFGNTLFSWRDKHGTEFVLAPIPLGGFVKMLDEREGEVKEEELEFAFNRKPVMHRLAIVAAGPLINFLFAVLVYWAIFMNGQQVLVPVVNQIETESIAEKSGLEVADEILKVDGELVESIDDVVQKLILKVLQPGVIELEVKNKNSQLQSTKYLEVEKALKVDEETSPLDVLGISIFPKIPATVGRIISGEAAEKAGLQVGDKIVIVDDVEVETWQDFVNIIKESPGIPLEVGLFRGEQDMFVELVPGAKTNKSGKVSGFVGIAPQQLNLPEDAFKEIKYNPLESLAYSLKKTKDSAVLTLASVWKLAVGDLSRDNLGGPIMIASIAGQSATFGLEPFLLFLAYISIVLGVMNLLPIPVLDGGHILFYIIESIFGKPVPENIQKAAMSMGIAFFVLVTMLAFYNDILRYW